ncbi:single-stranded-DNA-specific exonuclease RecJ [Rudanella paleaurantiibacter]|uniref:single-stranded-DNA-specific exonuclease RecJ n=1 Tax=Rudanella paleaurantiibacter TaxID=2614655 RepID=UPI001627DE23|nr:single-stranded-DNA-specific exonuclease RecJ [Rudanella paleaurantiibacter]
MKPRRWITKPFPDAPAQRAAIETLTHELKVSPFLASLLVQRGVSGYEEARVFFRPEIGHLHDPFAMRDMDRAITRLTMAMVRQEKILVYGDYDVDGTTSVALFYGFMKTLHPHLDYYIPDRYAEGYGISQAGVRWAADNGFTLIVALDCGIKSIDCVAEAKALGVDFIICDHHRPGTEIPDAAAVLDPKRVDCAYPYKELTGCGVGFKLLQALCIFNGIPLEQLYPFLDLVVVSIASDIVPITGENRVLAYYGLRCLNEQARPGLRALIKVANAKKDESGNLITDSRATPSTRQLDINDLVFKVGPRINAAGRIKHAKEAVRLLLADDDTEADRFALEINTHNVNRQKFDSGTTQQALAMIEADEWLKNAKSTVLFDASWHKGVIGIVASRCIEHYYRPTVILTQSNEKVAGSARSVPGFDVYEAIEECADLLEQFGGHTFAAGLTLKPENVSAFRQKFETVVSGRIQEEMLTPLIEIDMPLDFDQIDGKFVRILKQMGPFGPHNLQPVFCTEQVYLCGPVQTMQQKHLKFWVRQANSAYKFQAIGFNMAPQWADRLYHDEPLSICYQIEENHFNGQVSIQLVLKDIRCVDPTPPTLDSTQQPNAVA